MIEKGVKTDLYIVCDKSTKRQAKALGNKLVEKDYSCVVWNEKTFNDKEASTVNTNKFLFFSQALIDENMSMEIAKTRTISKGVSLVSIGNMHGIVVDPSVIIEKSFIGRNWWKYLITLVAAGLIGAVVLTPFLLIKDERKKAKIKLYFDAVKYFIQDDNIKLIIPD
ncbi:MAG: hypothetical protein IJK92_09250 [Bacteroidales bacterium]|nr:hypothetical protein [Bacteroidales bacterium]